MQKIKKNYVIFFDLDDTLINTSERQYRVYKEIINLLSIKQDCLSKKEFWQKKRIGWKTSDIIFKNDIKSNNEIKNKIEGEWIKRIEIRENLKYDRVINNAKNILSILRQKNIDLNLVTLRENKINLLWELKKLRLNKYFNQVFIGSPQKNKDKINIIKNIIKDIKKKKYPIIIGDSEIDIITGKALNIFTVGIASGIRSKSYLEKFKPSLILKNLSSILECLK